MEPRDRLRFGFLYVIHPRRSRPFLQTRSQSSQLLASPDRQYLDAAVVVVADPTGNLKNVRLPLHKPAEANALHTSAHHKAPSVDGRRTVCGSHGEIAEIRCQRSDCRVKTEAKASNL